MVKRKVLKKKVSAQPLSGKKPEGAKSSGAAWRITRCCLKLIGVSSLVGIIGIFVALNQLRPNLVIAGVPNPDSRFESEARLEFVNNGTFILEDFHMSWQHVHLHVGINDINIGTIDNTADSYIGRLSPKESVRIPALPSTETTRAMSFSECSYVLKITFKQSFLFFRSGKLKRSWDISLRNPGNSVSQWDIKPLPIE